MALGVGVVGEDYRKREATPNDPKLSDCEAGQPTCGDAAGGEGGGSMQDDQRSSSLQRMVRPDWNTGRLIILVSSGREPAIGANGCYVPEESMMRFIMKPPFDFLAFREFFRREQRDCFWSATRERHVDPLEVEKLPEYDLQEFYENFHAYPA